MEEHKIGNVTVNARVTGEQDGAPSQGENQAPTVDQEAIIAACCERVLEHIASLQSR